LSEKIQNAFYPEVLFVIQRSLLAVASIRTPHGQGPRIPGPETQMRTTHLENTASEIKRAKGLDCASRKIIGDFIS
jgi:hypothetical protein